MKGNIPNLQIGIIMEPMVVDFIENGHFLEQNKYFSWRILLSIV